MASASALFSLLLLLGSDPARGTSRLFAVVVGSNDPGGSGLARLQYADDDAIKNQEVLALLGANTRLLASVDGSTRGKYPESAQRAHRPTVENLLKALSETFAEMRAAKAAGHSTEFYFWYSGHGSVRGDGGVLLLENGGVFSRRDLYKFVLSASPASFNHLLIDACGAADFVSSRGQLSAEQRRAWQKRLLDSYADQQSLDRFRNVGVIFAATAEGRVHEWSRYEGGVFSFQLRSALLNGADVHGANAVADRKVSYLEAFAFLTAANQEVKGDSAHMDVVLRGHPDERERVIADWTGQPVVSSLRVGAGKARHLRVADEREIPLFETNKDIPDELWVVLPQRPGYVIQGLLPGGAERTVELKNTQGTIVYDDVIEGPQSLSVDPRGDLLPQLRRGLFQVPFGRSYYLGVVAQLRPRGGLDLEAAIEGAWPPSARAGSALRPWGYGLMVAALVGATGGALFYYAADLAHGDYSRAPPEDKARWRRKTERYDGLATASLIAAGLIGVTGGALLMVDWLVPGAAARDKMVSLGPSLGVTAGWRF